MGEGRRRRYEDNNQYMEITMADIRNIHIYEADNLDSNGNAQTGRGA